MSPSHLPLLLQRWLRPLWGPCGPIGRGKSLKRTLRCRFESDQGHPVAAHDGWGPCPAAPRPETVRAPGWRPAPGATARAQCCPHRSPTLGGACDDEHLGHLRVPGLDRCPGPLERGDNLRPCRALTGALDGVLVSEPLACRLPGNAERMRDPGPAPPVCSGNLDGLGQSSLIVGHRVRGLGHGAARPKGVRCSLDVWDAARALSTCLYGPSGRRLADEGVPAAQLLVLGREQAWTCRLCRAMLTDTERVAISGCKPPCTRSPSLYATRVSTRGGTPSPGHPGRASSAAGGQHWGSTGAA